MTRLIDADAFENYVFDEWKNNEISNGDWMTFREWLRDQETVVEFDGDLTKVIVRDEEYFPVKHGRWIEIQDDVFASTYKCSECGQWPFTEDGRWALTDYCPHCGARMEQKE